jgi:hypothetical protein
MIHVEDMPYATRPRWPINLSERVDWTVSGDNPNTTQTLEYTKDKYNVKIIK